MKTQGDMEKIRQLLNFFFQEEASLRFHFNNMSSVLRDNNLNSDEKLKVVEQGVKLLIKFFERNHRDFEVMWMHIHPDIPLSELFKEFALEGSITNNGIDPEDYNVAYPPDYEPLHEYFKYGHGPSIPTDRFGLIMRNGARRITVMLN